MPSLVFEPGGTKTIRHFPDELPIGLGATSDELLFVSRSGPIDPMPTSTPTRRKNTGSVIIHTPKKLTNTVEWPSHAGVISLADQSLGDGL